MGRLNSASGSKKSNFGGNQTKSTQRSVRSRKSSLRICHKYGDSSEYYRRSNHGEGRSCAHSSCERQKEGERGEEKSRKKGKGKQKEAVLEENGEKQNVDEDVVMGDGELSVGASGQLDPDGEQQMDIGDG